jgi:hypothetical protein
MVGEEEVRMRERKEVTVVVEVDCSHSPFFRRAEWWKGGRSRLVAVLGVTRGWCERTPVNVLG